MYIEVEGRAYYITIHNSDNRIYVSGPKGTATKLAVPAHLSQNELIAFIKNNLKDVNTHQSEDINGLILDLFDTSFTVVVNPILQIPYIKGKSLYLPKIPKSKVAHAKLSDMLLIQEIKQHISFWEETLMTLINDIDLRKLKANYYVICSSSKRITFKKDLIDKSREFIAYICAMAVFDFLSLEESYQEHIGSKYVKDWKHYQKVLHYERRDNM